MIKTKRKATAKSVHENKNPCLIVSSPGSTQPRAKVMNVPVAPKSSKRKATAPARKMRNAIMGEEIKL